MSISILKQHRNRFSSFTLPILFSNRVSNVKMAILFTVIILVFLVNGCWAVGDPLLENIESPLAFYQQGSLNDFNGTEHEQKLLFSRQECGQGYGVCGKSYTENMPNAQG